MCVCLLTIVQVAAGCGSMFASHACTFVNRLVGTRIPPAKLAGIPTASASEFLVLVDGKKINTAINLHIETRLVLEIKGSSPSGH